MSPSTSRLLVWLFCITATVVWISQYENSFPYKVCDFFTDYNVPSWIFVLLPTSLISVWLCAHFIFFGLNIPKLPTKNKAVFVSGCDSGFGYQLALRLSRRGYHVFAGCLFPNGDGAKKLLAENTENNGNALEIVPFDVTSQQSLDEALGNVELAMNNNEVLWAVVANAGLGHYGYLEWASEDKMRKLFDVNVFGVVRTFKIFAPLLRKSKGRLVVTTSWAGRIAPPTLIPYAMTKHSALALCDGLRAELSEFGIHVASVEPNMYRTSIVPMTTLDLDDQWASLTDEQRSSYGKRLLKKSRIMTIDFGYLCDDDLSVPLDAFEHAISARFPKSSYQCDRLSRWMFTRFVLWLPQEFLNCFCNNIHRLLIFGRRTTYGRYASAQDNEKAQKSKNS